MTLNNDALIKKDRLRFTKNKLSANLTYFAIVFDCLYYISIYSSDVGNYYYKWLIGISVVYNLLFLLFAFLASEGVKQYSMGYSYFLMVLGLGQVARIFIIPMKAVTGAPLDGVAVENITEPPMSSGQFIYVVCVLVASAAMCILAGVIGVIKSATLKAHVAEVEKRNK